MDPNFYIFRYIFVDIKKTSPANEPEPVFPQFALLLRISNSCYKGQPAIDWRVPPLSQAIELLLETFERHPVIRYPFEPRRKTYDELTEWHQLLQVQDLI